MSEKIKPCPFCNGKCQLSNSSTWFQNKWMDIISCDECAYVSQHFLTKFDAIAAHNALCCKITERDEAVGLLRAIVDLWRYPKRKPIYEAETFLAHIDKIGGGE